MLVDVGYQIDWLAVWSFQMVDDLLEQQHITTSLKHAREEVLDLLDQVFRMVLDGLNHLKLQFLNQSIINEALRLLHFLGRSSGRIRLRFILCHRRQFFIRLLNRIPGIRLLVLRTIALPTIIRGDQRLETKANVLRHFFLCIRICHFY